MNWEAIGAVGEIVGATAVVVTLIYLAVQVRHTTRATDTARRATQAASFQAASALDQDFLLTLGKDPVTAQLWNTYLTDPETLSTEQKRQGLYLFISFLRRLENLYFQDRLGTLSEEGWQSRQGMFLSIARSRGYSAFLNSGSAIGVTGEFAKYMAQLNSDD